jgi:plasmid stabilization system protein ParE
VKVSYTLPALADLDHLLGEIAQHSPHGASRVKASIKAAERLLGQFPLAGAQTRLSWLRRMKIAFYPYLILYEVTDSEVIIHTVRHTSRRPIT